MKFFLSDPQRTKNPAMEIRRAGYHPETNREGEPSFAKSLSGAVFPRFHVYINNAKGGWEITLHLDQKKPTYEEGKAHSGEYEGSVIEEEMLRIKRLFAPKLEIEALD